MTICQIDWSPRSVGEWDEMLKKVYRSSLLQHFPYAQAQAVIEPSGVRHGVIDIDGTHAGMVQLNQVGAIRNLIQAVSLDRGPLWFPGFGEPAHVRAFAACLAHDYRRRPGRKFRLLPELCDRAEHRDALESAGFRRRQDMPGYKTIWLDLNRSPARLRKSLQGKWRNVLQKAERAAPQLVTDWTGETSIAFLQAYAADKEAKGYQGPSVKLLMALLRFMVPRHEALILTAREDDEDLAAILVLLHGSSATYQAGWTSQKGRQLGAHNLLLWRAVELLQSHSITAFDLGGINDDDAKGVTRFKKGMGGEVVELVGFYR